MKYFVIPILLLLVSCGTTDNKSKKESIGEDWVSLFNGKDFDGWDIKIKGSDQGVNYKNTFRVEEGLLKVRYDEYEKFNNEFGHIFYKTSFSHYKLRVEYRFVGEQCPGGPSWAFRNSGVMLHSQSVTSMGKDQDFPVSIEAQFLGGDGVAERHTSNVCTPGTNIVIHDSLITQHCNESTSKTYHGDVWVTAEFEVMGDSIINHILEGKVVMSYSKPQVGGGNGPKDYPVPVGTLISSGYICLQAESHPIDFRKVEILDLDKDKR
jgi:hypothetical protein